MLSDYRHCIDEVLTEGWYFVCINKRGIKPSHHFLRLRIDYGDGYDRYFSYKFSRCANKSLLVAIYIKATTKNLLLESRLAMPFNSLSISRIPGLFVQIFLFAHRLHAVAISRSPNHFTKWIKAISLIRCDIPTPQKISIYGHANKRTYRNYSKWITCFEAVATNQKPKLGKIKFSVILPVFNPNLKLLEEAIDSVKSQLYANWELCISCRKPYNRQVEALLQKETFSNYKIKVIFENATNRLSESRNNALALASGDYCLSLGQHDLLRPHSLLEVYRAIKNNPNLEFIYSDDDDVDDKGNRSSPRFKPQINRDLLYSQNYLNYLVVLKVDSMRQVGSWRVDYEGSNDYDLYLRFLHKLQPEKIFHIPQILYHQRAVKEVVASETAGERSSVNAGVKVLQDYFVKLNPLAKVAIHESGGHYRIHWPLPDILPKVSIIMPTKDNLKYLRKAVESVIQKTSYQNYEIIIVNNNSSQPESLLYLEQVKGFDERIQVICYNAEFNYSTINNKAAEYCTGDILCMMNDDVEIINSGWLGEMVSHAIRPEIGCVGAKLYYENDTIQHAGIILGLGGDAGHYHSGVCKESSGYCGRLKSVQNFSAVTAALMLVQKSIYDQVGGFDEKWFKIAYNDVDLCLKVQRAGYRNLFTPHAEAYHYESTTRKYARHSEEGNRQFKKEKEALNSRWQELIDNDPAYSPNLSKYSSRLDARTWPQ